jgi:hypothetical protein
VRKNAGAWHQWITIIILATQKAEIRRITVQNQPRQIVLGCYCEKNITKKVGELAQGVFPELKLKAWL